MKKREGRGGGDFMNSKGKRSLRPFFSEYNIYIYTYKDPIVYGYHCQATNHKLLLSYTHLDTQWTFKQKNTHTTSYALRSFLAKYSSLLLSFSWLLLF